MFRKSFWIIALAFGSWGGSIGAEVTSVPLDGNDLVHWQADNERRIRPPELTLPMVDEWYGSAAEKPWYAATSPSPERESTVESRDKELIDETARPQAALDPSLGLGLSGIADWSTQHPFLDLMKTARPWLGHEPGRWGAWDNSHLKAGGFLSETGWPVAIPEGVERLETFVLTGQPSEFQSLAGTYVLRWEGTGAVEVSGPVEDITRDTATLRFSYAPDDEGLVAIAVTRIDPSDPIRDLTLVREDRLPLYEAGAVFNPDFLARVRDFRALRFMDWMATNGSTQVTWEDRPEVADSTWAEKGVPVEIMVQLANEVGADPWFTIPHQADDAYVEAFATYVRDHLDPRLRIYAEWSNEVWNFTFPQSHWASEQAQARWGEAAGDDAWMQFAGLRAAEVADIWTRTFAHQSDERLVRVVAVHTGWPGLETSLLLAPLAVAEGRAAPAASFDAYAVTGYFGHAIGSEEMAPMLREWIETGVAEAEVTALALEEIERLTLEIWPYHHEAAAAHGLQLVAYEGGTHITGQGSIVDDEQVTGFLIDYSYSADMATLYERLLSGWTEAGGTLFMAFVDVAGPSKWGSWGALRTLEDSNPRWDVLVAANAISPSWETRDPALFAQGVQSVGTEGGDDLTGTPEEDDLVGLGGDDTLVAEGSDRLHGGPGLDRAVLPGAMSDWTRTSEDGAVLLIRGREIVQLTEVEEVLFAGTGDVLSLREPH